MKNLHVLVVDDDPIFVTVAEGIISTSVGCTVSVAEDGEMALRKLASATPPIDVVILDLNMPHLDGLAFLRRISELDFGGCVILSSGETQAVLDTARRMSHMLGIRMTGSLRKPMRRDEFVAELAKCKALLSTVSARSARAPDPSSKGELTLVYQPQVCSRTGDLVGLEALARLRTLDGRLLGPGAVFHPGLTGDEVRALTLDIAAMAMRDAANGRTGPLAPRVSINLDARDLDSDEVVAALIRLAREQSIDPASILFELTETALPQSLTGLMERLARLRIAGFGLSLDDYGTGTSNFELLRLCPFTELKIDRSIVQSASGDKLSRLFLHSALAMAETLGIEVVAEGVETRAELALVRDLGIPVVQGYVFSRPLAPELAFTTARYAVPEIERSPA